MTSAAGGRFIVAAAHGTTLTLRGSTGWALGYNIPLEFGAAGQDGTVVWFTPTGSTGHAITVDIKAGTLKAGDANLGAMLEPTYGSMLVETTAKIDLAGFDDNPRPGGQRQGHDQPRESYAYPR